KNSKEIHETKAHNYSERDFWVVRKKGEIVLIEQDLLPRSAWSYGKVIDLNLSNDGLVRSAKVLTPNGNVLQRPLNKLYPLEIRAVDKDATEAPKECTPRELGQLRTVINEFEDSLQEPNSSQFTLRVEPIQESLNNQTSRSRQQKSTFPSLTSGNLKMGLTILAILALAVPSYANYPSCHNGIVEIAGKTHPYELCFNEDCRKFVGDGIAMTYELPISPLHNATNVTVNYINNEGPMVFTTICANPEFCSKSNSLFSPSLLGNPHCWPVGAIVSVALIAYFMMVIMIIPIWFIVSLFRSRDSQPSTNIQINCNNTTHAENINLHSWNPAPLSGGLLITLCITLAAICKGAAACQHGFTRHATDIICNQDGICSYEFSREFLFNRIQTVHCIEIRSQNKTVGFLKMRNTAVILT
ncbi:hypothetical protein OSTOST_05904, partial [Ostertagia ostertagi]